MATRIGGQVLGGELNNTRRNSVSGWLEFAEDEGIKLELAGNLEGELAGRHIRFTVAPPENGGPGSREILEAIEFRQIGVVGTMSLRMFRVLDVPIEDALARREAGEPFPAHEEPCLYLEWFSQNGRMVAEILAPCITFGPQDKPGAAEPTPDPIPDSQSDEGPDVVGFFLNEAGDIEQRLFGDAEEEEDNPFDLFPPDLEARLNESGDNYSPPEPPPPKSSGRRPWDEVIPGIDPETKKMYEEWDEIFEGTSDEPISTLFDPPLSLVPPSAIENEAQAQACLTVVLARLALYSVAVDICPHFTARKTYHWLFEEIFPEATIYPRLPGTGFVAHYPTWEFCSECEAEFDAEHETRREPDED